MLGYMLSWRLLGRLWCFLDTGTASQWPAAARSEWGYKHTVFGEETRVAPQYIQMKRGSENAEPVINQVTSRLTTPSCLQTLCNFTVGAEIVASKYSIRSDASNESFICACCTCKDAGDTDSSSHRPSPSFIRLPFDNSSFSLNQCRSFNATAGFLTSSKLLLRPLLGIASHRNNRRCISTCSLTLLSLLPPLFRVHVWQRYFG